MAGFVYGASWHSTGKDFRTSSAACRPAARRQPVASPFLLTSQRNVISTSSSRRRGACGSRTSYIVAAASGSTPVPSSGDSASSSGQTENSVDRVRVGLYFALWYFFNALFNLANKGALNIWAYPWTISTVQLGVGSAYCAILWIFNARQRPNVTPKLLRAMFLPTLGHLIGHVSTCVAFSHVAISFAHIVKAAEPAFGAIGSALFLNEVYSFPVYLSLLPVIAGVALSAVSELTFTWFGFATAMLSNVAFAARNIFTKISMTDVKGDPTLTPQNLYGLTSIMAFCMELPMALIADKGILSLNLAAAGVAKATVLQYVLGSALLYHLYNETSYLALSKVSPVTFSVANTVKRIIIIVTAVIVFKTKVLPSNAVGMAIAVAGTFLYSIVKERYQRKKLAN